MQRSHDSRYRTHPCPVGALFPDHFDFTTQVVITKGVADEYLDRAGTAKLHHGGPGELHAYRALLRRPRLRQAGRADPRLAPERGIGDADRIVPITASAEPLAKAVKGARKVVIEGGPHCITWTHAEQVTKELLAFLK